jgi:hypothetical protein
LKVRWLRGRKYIDFHRPHTWFTLGVRGSGKSSLLEHAGELYREEGHTILDLFGSRDGEGLAWLRKPGVDLDKVLLLHGDNVELEAPCDGKPATKLKLSDLQDYEIVISSSPLYNSPDEEFQRASDITNLLYKRLSWSKLCYVIVREAANLYYSRLKVTSNQTQAKADMTYLIREARHMGVALGLDTLKYTSIDVDIRNVTYYMIFKSQGITGLPRSLWWVYKYIDPHKMRKMKPNQFVILSREGPLGLGVFPELKWHKQEREDIVKNLGIHVEYGAEVQYAESKGTFYTVGDPEHAEMIRDYIEGKGGMGKIADAYGVSSGTVYNHVNFHNEDLEKIGECQRCMRAASQYSKAEAKRMV